MRNYEAKLVDSSRLIADILVKDIGQDSERFAEMLEIALTDKYPISMRASRIIAICAENHPFLIEKHLGRLIEKLEQIKVDGVKRGILKIFAEQKPAFSEDEIGYITDLAFRWLADTSQAMAIRYYCIEIVLDICQKYPDLINEFILVLDTLKIDNSAGLRSRSKQVLYKFNAR